MPDERYPQRGAAEEASDAPLTETEVEAAQRSPSEPREPSKAREPSESHERDASEEPQEQAAGGREAEQAHGGSMAPGMVDATGNQIAEPAPTETEQ